MYLRTCVTTIVQQKTSTISLLSNPQISKKPDTAEGTLEKLPFSFPLILATKTNGRLVDRII